MNIPYKALKFTFVFLFLALLGACRSNDKSDQEAKAKINYREIKKVELMTPFGAKLDTTIVITIPDQRRGLSGIKEANFSDDQAMLFFYTEDELHEFWMPYTFFDLDLFYLDKNFRVIGIKRQLKHFPAKGPEHLIPRAEPFFCRHVIEMKSSSPIAQKIGMGMNLKWTSRPSPSQIESSIRREQ